MNAKEKAVREAAAALYDAIVAAQKAGFVVTLPASVEGLRSISISETAKASEEATVTVVAHGVEPGSPEHEKARQAAQKAVDTVAEPVPAKK